MTQFEIIILGIIYLVCYGFTIVWFAKEENNVWFRLLASIMCLVLAFYAPLMIGAIIYEKLKDNEQKHEEKYELKFKTQLYIDKHIKSIFIERREDKFYGTLIDKEGITFEFSKDVTYIEKFFGTAHNENPDIRDLMLMNCFKRMFISEFVKRVKYERQEC